MNQINILLIILSLLVFSQAIATNNKDSFLIKEGQSHLLSFNLEHPTRITIVQYHGYAQVKVKTEHQVIYQNQLPFVQI